MDRREFVGKIEWEGGVYDALDYGLRASDIDDDDVEFRTAWADLEEAFNFFQGKMYVVEDLLEEYFE